MSDEINVEAERMKLCYIDFASSETDGINIKSKSTSIRSKSLEECLKYTQQLHNEK